MLIGNTSAGTVCKINGGQQFNPGCRVFNRHLGSGWGRLAGAAASSAVTAWYSSGGTGCPGSAVSTSR